MTEYLSALRRLLDTHPPDLGDADSVLNLLYEAYSECNPMADAQIKDGFHELYQLVLRIQQLKEKASLPYALIFPFLTH